MPKLTAQQQTDLLSKLLAQVVELAENDTDSDYDADALISAIDKNRTPIIKQLVAQDIKGEVTRTTMKGLRKELSELTGIPVADLSDLDSKPALEKALTHYKSSIPDGGKEAQAKIDQMLATHNAAIANKETEWSTKYSELENRLTRKSMIDVLAKYHREAAGLPEKANREKLAALFLPTLEGRGIPKLNDAGDDIELYDPKNPETRLLNASGTGYVSISDIMKPHYSELGMWNEDTRDTSAAAAARNAKTGLETKPAPSTAMPSGSPQAAYASFREGLG